MRKRSLHIANNADLPPHLSEMCHFLVIMTYNCIEIKILACICSVGGNIFVYECNFHTFAQIKYANYI